MGPRAPLSAIALLGLLALPASAQYIPAGDDYWRTPGNGNSYAAIPSGELEALCGVNPDSSWNRIIGFRGVPVIGDADTVVRRLQGALLAKDGDSADVEVQVRALSFESISTHNTPCGTVRFTAGLAGDQPITSMTITRTSKLGGSFASDLLVKIEIIAYYADPDADDGSELGRLYYTFDLPSPPATPWTFASVLGVGVASGWLPAVSPSSTPGNPPDCWEVARAKIGKPPYDRKDPAAHAYYIADLQAKGICPPIRP
jgi:hypothetical protein